MSETINWKQPESVVKGRWKEANAEFVPHTRSWIIRNILGGNVIGHGATEAEAWASALQHPSVQQFEREFWADDRLVVLARWPEAHMYGDGRVFTHGNAKVFLGTWWPAARKHESVQAYERENRLAAVPQKENDTECITTNNGRNQAIWSLIQSRTDSGILCSGHCVNPAQAWESAYDITQEVVPQAPCVSEVEAAKARVLAKHPDAQVETEEVSERSQCAMSKAIDAAWLDAASRLAASPDPKTHAACPVCKHPEHSGQCTHAVCLCIRYPELHPPNQLKPAPEPLRDAGEPQDERFTERGFENYCQFRDTYGSKIVVRESSGASEHCVWICAQDNPNMKEPSPHLNAEQARIVAEALLRFAAPEASESPA